MKQIIRLRTSLLLWVILTMTLPGCAQSPAADTSAEAEVLSRRLHDEPPVVDATRTYQLPVDTRIALAGNYGELRPDHFHAGLDFKTDQTIGHPVYAFADGYVRRLGINASGYGLVLYVEHPQLGLTSVYGHLETFNDTIWSHLRPRQVAEQLNNAQVTFAVNEIPVHEGDIIALSGNTGRSGGPHVHFELRNITGKYGGPSGDPDEDDDIFYDPQMFFLRELKDTQPPRVLNTYLYPLPGEGAARSQQQTAWGRVGLGIKAYDYMDGQANKYGVKELRLYQDDRLIYHFRQDAFRYSEQRYTNSLTDYAAWMGQKSMVMKAFIEPGNHLQQVSDTLGDGIVVFDQERLYHFTFELEDAHGNLTRHKYNVRGQQMPIEPRKLAPNCVRIESQRPLCIDSAGCRLTGAVGTFYTDVDFPFVASDPTPASLTPVYTLGDRLIPMHDFCELQIRLPDSLTQTSQLYLADAEGGGAVSGSTYECTEAGAVMRGRIRRGGRFTVMRDAQGPQVSIVKAGYGTMQIQVADGGSGLCKFCVLIDGQFVPFDRDNRGRYIGHPEHYGIEPHQLHRIEIIASDLCGNETRVTDNRTF